MFQPHPHCTFIRPKIDQDKSILLSYGGLTLFETFSAQIIIKLISAVLLEQKIVVVSKNLHTLTAIIFTIISLLEPFSYQGIVIPILHQGLIDVLDAPVPFIVGMNVSPKTDEGEYKQLVILDADSHTFVSPEKIEVIPFAAKLCGYLSAIVKPRTLFSLSKLFSSEESPYQEVAAPISLEPKEIRFEDPLDSSRPSLAHIADGFFTSLSSLVKDFQLCCITSIEHGVSVLMQETLIDTIDKDSQKFATAFFQTQIFKQYQDKRLLEIDKEKEEAKHSTKRDENVMMQPSAKSAMNAPRLRGRRMQLLRSTNSSIDSKYFKNKRRSLLSQETFNMNNSEDDENVQSDLSGNVTAKKKSGIAIITKKYSDDEEDEEVDIDHSETLYGDIRSEKESEESDIEDVISDSETESSDSADVIRRKPQ